MPIRLVFALVCFHTTCIRASRVLVTLYALDNSVRVAAAVIFGAVASAMGVGAVFCINALMLGGAGMIARRDAHK